VAFYQQHVTDGTFPPVIFGTRKLFLERFRTLADPLAELRRQKVWKEQWDEGRNGRLSARGDRTKNGNPLLRIHEGSEHWMLEISLDGDPEKKGIRYRKLSLPLYIARKVHSKTGKINGRDYEGLLRRVLASGDPYQVEILRRHGRYQVRITVEEAPVALQTYPVNGWVGVDTNVTFLALCHVRPDGNPQGFATFGDSRLYDARATQRDAIIGEVTHQAVQWAKERGAGLVVEDLDFIHDKDVSAKFNRVTHQFTYRAFLTALKRQAAREGVEVCKVKPAYTSIIGRLKYQPQYGISVHHAAALVIGRRGGLKVWRENVPKPLREWMQRRGKWNDPIYRRTDGSARNNITQEIKTVLLKDHQYLNAWLGQRHQIYPH
jgi:IS605 OrfB family transposase